MKDREKFWFYGFMAFVSFALMVVTAKLPRVPGDLIGPSLPIGCVIMAGFFLWRANRAEARRKKEEREKK